MGPGHSLPDAYYQRSKSDPNAFSFQHGYRALVNQLLENRISLANGGGGDQAEAVAALLGGTTVSGTKFLPLLLATSPDSPTPPYDPSVLGQKYFDSKPGTLTDLYSKMSYGNLNVQGVVLNWRQLSQNADWYAGDNYQDANGTTQPCNGFCVGNAWRISQMVQELVSANPGVDWGKFSNNGPDRQPNSGDDNGFVDFVAIVHPGSGAECYKPGSSPHIWSFRGHLDPVVTTPTPWVGHPGAFLQISDFVIVPALDCSGNPSEPNPIGVVSHEFGHAFGLPDLYDLNTTLVGGQQTTTVGGVGTWDLMALGAWGGDWDSPQLPTWMSAWSQEYLNWVKPLPVPFDIDDIALVPIEKKPMAYKVPGTGQTYFLLSNRNKEGYDVQLPNSGLLIEQVDSVQVNAQMSNNRINSYPGSGVKVVEGDGQTRLTDFETTSTWAGFNANDVFPVRDGQNLDANSSPATPGPFALCGIHKDETTLLIHAQLLVSTTTCPRSEAVVAQAPGAAAVATHHGLVVEEGILTRPVSELPGGQAKQPNQPPAAKAVSLSEISEHPERFAPGEKVSLQGLLQNTGDNYFTDLEVRLADATGRTIPVSIGGPTEVVPPGPRTGNPPSASTLSQLLDRQVTVIGTLGASTVNGQEKTLVLHVTDVKPKN